jgi:hypothetical protein
MVSKELLAKFKSLYQEEFEIELTDEEATMMANDLVNLMRILLKPEPKESNEERTENETLREIRI